MDANATVTGQIVFREAVGSSSSGGGLVSWKYSLGVGLLHVPPGALARERVHGVLVTGFGGSLRFQFHSQPRPLSQRFSEQARLCDVNGLITGMEVAAPPGPAALLAHGGFYLRESRFPGPAGADTLIVAAVLRHEPRQLVERAVYEIAGDISRFTVSRPVPSPEAFPIGSVPEQTLRAPIWRARDGLRSLSSSMRLDLIDLCDELRGLEAVEEGDRTPEQAARFAALSRTEAGFVLGISRNDSEFTRFKRLAREMGEPAPHAFSSYPTAEENEAQEESVKRVMEAMFSGGSPSSPSMAR